ncbi:LysR family transcriptional regulator [Pseudomonas sp. ML96]|uniref:LysR family transcriptional regulator n=1 Tax=Pseudomonas sp. ML96 TaxID=1523503 RepID=UPI00068AAC4F|nr:LysR family transcriptional regulator [Pseudomonas sp. ML96]
MTIKQIRAFLAVAQSLSFAQACLRLHMSQPALSLAIKNLETSLGGPLLSRTTRSVALTPEGETLLPIAQRLLAEWENTEDLLRQHFTLQLGRVSIAAMPSFAANCLPQAIKAFRDRHPRINVTVHDVINEQVVEMVRDRRVELGVVLEPDNLDGLEFISIYLDRFIAVVPPNSDLHALTEINWHALKAHPFIALQRPSAVRRVIESQVGQLPVAFESHQFTTIGRMVQQGLGVSIVPSICEQQMQELGACCITINDPQIERRIGLIKQDGIELSAAAQALAETLQQLFVPNYGGWACSATS